MAKPSLIDRVVSALSPARGVRRERQRALAAAWRQARMHYDGATAGRRAFGWTTVSSDANTVAVSARSRLRDVARDLVRNSTTGKRAVSVISNNIVGAGIIPTIQAKDEVLKEKLEDLLKQHFDTIACDASGKMDLYGLQALAIKSIVSDGEVLIRRRRRLSTDGLPLPFQLQVLEADYIDASIDGVGPVNSNNTVLQGVEFNPFGKIVGYHVFDQHPGSTSNFSARATSSFVPASEIAHVYMVERPGQVRGVSWFAPVILRIKDLGDFKEAHLMRQKIAACFAAFIESDEDFQADDRLPEPDGGGPPFEEFEPGMIEHLLPGQKVSFGSPPQVQDYDPYVKSIERDIAAGMGVSYEAMTGDLSGVNFSSGRMGWLEFQRSVDGWRNYMLIPQMLGACATWFFEGAALVIGSRITSPDVVMKWTSPRREMISPGDEVGAIRNAIRSGITSRSEEQRKLGFDPVELDNEIAEDNARADALGLVLDTDARKTSAAGLTQARPDGTVIPPPNAP